MATGLAGNGTGRAVFTRAGRPAAGPGARRRPGLAPAAVIALLLAPLPAKAAQIWHCTVGEFTSTGTPDLAFDLANMRKRFVLTVGPDDILVAMQSDEFEGSTERYRLFFADYFDLFAVSDDLLRLGTVAIPLTPRLDEGFFEASITLQASAYVNVWMLRCTA